MANIIRDLLQNANNYVLMPIITAIFLIRAAFSWGASTKPARTDVSNTKDIFTELNVSADNSSLYTNSMAIIPARPTYAFMKWYSSQNFDKHDVEKLCEALLSLPDEPQPPKGLKML